MRSLRLAALFCLLFFTTRLHAQTILDINLKPSAEKVSLTRIIQTFNTDSTRVFYLEKWVSPISVQVQAEETLDDLLSRCFKSSDFSYFLMDDETVVLVKDPTKAIVREKLVKEALRREEKIETYQFGEPGKVTAAQVTITGRVVDLKSEEPISFASIQVGDESSSYTSDEAGYFTITISPGPNVLTFRFVEYENTIVNLDVYQNATINVSMEKKSTLLNEVVIQDKSDREQSKTRIGVATVSVSNIKKTPTFLGEPDLVKSIQRLPGVTTVGEAASGFNVRGGSVDQNLILYDGIPIFNSAHVFGFFSAFNADGIQDVNFYRGGIPAKFGGRISSVMNIRSKDGDLDEWHFKAGVGLITSNFNINGPIKKGKTTLNTSFRSTYSDWLIQSIRTNYADLRNSSVNFFDASTKVSHLFNEDSKLSITAYASNDGFRLVGDTTYSWHNYQLSGKYNRQFTPSFSGEFVLGSSSYGYDMSNDDPRTASNLSFNLLTSAFKSNFVLDKGAHQYSFGWDLHLYHIQPGRLTPNSEESNVNEFAMDKQVSAENAFYISDTWTYSDRLTLEYGIRLPMFSTFGTATSYEYAPDQPREQFSITDTISFSAWQPTKFYAGLEPRASLIYKLTDQSSFKVGYNTVFQYLHLISNSTAVTPVDIWQPSGKYFKPQRADQLSMGYAWDSEKGTYSASTEVFYKNINNLLDFKDGAELLLNEHLETDLLQGNGNAYGVELTLSKNIGRLSGDANYTYSRSFRKIDGNFNSETINDGEKYPSNFDQPHIANLNWRWMISRRYSFTGNFTYHTGRPITIPLSAIQIENQSIAYFSKRNQYRIPDYHRLDLAFVIEGNNKRSRKWQGTWVFSVYNVYARRNPYTIFFQQNDEGVLQPYQLSIIGTAFPSVSYNLKIK